MWLLMSTQDLLGVNFSKDKSYIFKLFKDLHQRLQRDKVNDTNVITSSQQKNNDEDIELNTRLDWTWSDDSHTNNWFSINIHKNLHHE